MTGVQTCALPISQVVSALTQHAGADLLGAYVDRALGRPIDRDSLRARPGVRMARHFVEVFEPCD